MDTVEEKFRNGIVIPAHRPEKQMFFCPVGLVGAGKTTVTKPISEELGLVRLSSDELRKLLKENGQTYAPLKEILVRVAGDFVEKGYSISFDMDCGNTDTRDFILAAARKRGISVFWVHVNTPADFIFEKFRKHPPSWLASDPQFMIDNYNAQKEKRLRENSPFDFIFTFDTSRADLPGQIDACVSAIRAGLSSHAF